MIEGKAIESEADEKAVDMLLLVPKNEKSKKLGCEMKKYCTKYYIPEKFRFVSCLEKEIEKKIFESGKSESNDAIVKRLEKAEKSWIQEELQKERGWTWKDSLKKGDIEKNPALYEDELFMSTVKDLKELAEIANQSSCLSDKNCKESLVNVVKNAKNPTKEEIIALVASELQGDEAIEKLLFELIYENEELRYQAFGSIAQMKIDQ